MLNLKVTEFSHLLLCLFGVGANENYSLYNNNNKMLKRKSQEKLRKNLFIFPVAVVEENVFYFSVVAIQMNNFSFIFIILFYFPNISTGLEKTWQNIYKIYIIFHWCHIFKGKWKWMNKKQMKIQKKTEIFPQWLNRKLLPHVFTFVLLLLLWIFFYLRGRRQQQRFPCSLFPVKC